MPRAGADFAKRCKASSVRMRALQAVAEGQGQTQAALVFNEAAELLRLAHDMARRPGNVDWGRVDEELLRIFATTAPEPGHPAHGDLERISAVQRLMRKVCGE